MNNKEYERPGVEPIDLDKLEDDHRKGWEEVRTLLQDAFPKSPPLYGYLEILMGSAKKRITGADGGISEVDWEDEEIFAGGVAYSNNQEANLRSDMNDDLNFAVGSQMMHFRTKSEAELSGAIEMSMLIFDLQQRLSSRKGRVFDRYGENYRDSGYLETEMLEAFRRTVLRPSYSVYQGQVDGGITRLRSYDQRSFFESSFKRHDEIHQELGENYSYEEFYKIQREEVGDNVESYTDEEWSEILEDEMVYATEFLKLFVGDTLNSARFNIKYDRRLMRGGKFIYSDTDLADREEKLAKAENIAREIQMAEDFRMILPIIKQQLGEDASFIDLFQLLNPIDLTKTPKEFDGSW